MRPRSFGFVYPLFTCDCSPAIVDAAVRYAGAQHTLKATDYLRNLPYRGGNLVIVVEICFVDSG
jgi:hypothetical protein